MLSPLLSTIALAILAFGFWFAASVCIGTASWTWKHRAKNVRTRVRFRVNFFLAVIFRSFSAMCALLVANIITPKLFEAIELWVLHAFIVVLAVLSTVISVRRKLESLEHFIAVRFPKIVLP